MRGLIAMLAALALASGGAALVAGPALARDGGACQGTSGRGGPGPGGGDRDQGQCQVTAAAPTAVVRVPAPLAVVSPTAPATPVVSAPPPPAPASVAPEPRRDSNPAPAESTDGLIPAFGIAIVVVAIVGLIVAGFHARRRLAIEL